MSSKPRAVEAPNQYSRLHSIHCSKATFSVRQRDLGYAGKSYDPIASRPTVVVTIYARYQSLTLIKNWQIYRVNVFAIEHTMSAGLNRKGFMKHSK